MSPWIVLLYWVLLVGGTWAYVIWKTGRDDDDHIALG